MVAPTCPYFYINIVTRLTLFPHLPDLLDIIDKKNFCAPLEGAHTPAAHHCQLIAAIVHKRDKGVSNVGR